MISFSEIKDAGSLDPVRELFPSLECEAEGELDMMLESFLALSAEVDGVGLTERGGCLLVRICDGGEYLFLFPLPVSEDADVGGALVAISEYVRREMLTFRLTDVPRWGIDIIRELFPYVNAKVYEDDDDTFAAMVLNELDMLDDIPAVRDGELALVRLNEVHTAAYARLCSDRELNRFWGYDGLADNPEGDPELFMLTAERERLDGVALSLAIEREGTYLGEAVIYDFDFRGSAEIGIRILPEYHGAGLGSRVLKMLVDYCEGMGLTAVRARVMSENEAAVKMTERHLPRVGESDGIVHFRLEL